MSKQQQDDKTMEFDDETGFVHEIDDGAAPGPQADTAPADTGGMDQLRGILLGPLSQELEAKVRTLSERLEKSTSELARKNGDRVTELEGWFRDELRRLKDEMGAARQNQADEIRETQKTLDAGVKELNEKLQSFVELVTQSREEQRSEWSREVAAIRESLDQLTTNLEGRLDEQKRTLRGELVDRGSLSAALSEVALRVAGMSDLASVDPTQPDIDLDGVLDGVGNEAELPGVL